MKQLKIYKNHEEFYQIATIGLWRAYTNYDEAKGNFPAYAFSTVRGELLSELRKQATYDQRYTVSDSTIFEFQATEDTMFQREIVEGYCTELSEVQKKVIMGIFVENKTFQQIAEEEGVEIGRVRSWYRYGLEKVKRNVLR